MHQDELLARLNGIEWNDFECKRAQRGVPEDAYKTVSAFANTAGGWLVFGVSEAHGRLEVAARRGLTPLVGREQEVRLLLERWGAGALALRSRRLIISTPTEKAMAK